MDDNAWEKRFLIIAIGVLLLSAPAMFYDILKFLPDYKTDENEIVEYAVGFLGGDMDQRFYSYGPLFAYLLSGIYRVLSWFVPGNVDDFAQRIFFDNTIFYYIVRLFNSLFALGTGWVIFKISEQVWRRRMAYWALGLLLFPFAELLTVFTPRVDLLLGLSYALCLYFILRYFDTSFVRDILLSAFFGGLGFAIKPLPSLLITPSIVLAFLFLQMYPRQGERQGRGKLSRTKKSRKKKKPKSRIPAGSKLLVQQDTGAMSDTPLWKSWLIAIPRVLRDKRLYLFGGVFLLSAFAFFPHAFLHWNAPGGFWEQQIQRIAYEGGKQGTPGWRLDVYLANLGYLFVAMGVVGVVVGWIRAYLQKDSSKLILFTLPIVFLLVFMRGPARVYWYAAIPYFMVLGIVDLVQGILRNIASEAKAFAVGSAILLLLIAQPGYGLIQRTLSYNSDSDFSNLRTALAAKRWAEQYLDKGASIAMYGYYVNLPRLVTKDVATQAMIGEYFMYYRGNNRYYVDLFKKAHTDYIQDPKHPTFKLLNTLEYIDGNQKKGVLSLRSRNKQVEEQLLPLLRQNRARYFISNYQMPDNWQPLLLKSFKREDFIDGLDVYIYDLTRG